MPIDFQIPLEGGHLLRCTSFPAREEPQSLIIITHGYKGFKDWGMFPYVAEQLSQSHHVVTVNFSHNGVGENPEKFTELSKFAINTYARELQDLEELIDWLRKDAILSKLPLFLIGHSRGAGTCLVYALDHPNTIQGVLSWNGLTTLDLLTDQQKEDMRKVGRSYVLNGRTGQQMPLDTVLLEDIEQNSERYDLHTRMSSADFAVILIQGTLDTARLQQGSEQLVQAYPHIQWVHIPHGNHTFNTVHPFRGTTDPLDKAIEASLTFIADTLAIDSPS